MKQAQPLGPFVADNRELRNKMLIDNEYALLFRKVQEYLPDSQARHALGDEVISQAMYQAYKELREYTLWNEKA